VYDQEVFLALRKIRMTCDFPCGKRLAPFLPEIIPALERWGESELEEAVRGKLHILIYLENEEPEGK